MRTWFCHLMGSDPQQRASSEFVICKMVRVLPDFQRLLAGFRGVIKIVL